MENLVCLDTGVLIGLLRKNEQVIAWFNSIPAETQTATTLITLFELYKGAYQSKFKEKELQDIEELKEEIVILPLNREHMKEAAQEIVFLQKNGKGIDIRDLIIGIVARKEGYSLKTYNKKHFENIHGLKLTN